MSNCYAKMKNFSKLLVLAFMTLSVFYVASTSAEYEHCVDSSECSDKICSNDESIVYALENEMCILFRNRCHYDVAKSANPELVELSKDECKNYCPFGCTRELDPVCGEHNAEFRTFANPCVMKASSCSENKSFILYRHDTCES